MKLKCIVVDDEPIASEGISDYVRQIDSLRLCGVFPNAIEANNFLATEEVDLVFLDIEMPKLNGISFVQSLSDPPMIVFTTAYPNHALKGFELDVLDYLVKPISFERFLKTANKAIERKAFITQQNKDPKDNYIFIKSDSIFHKIKHSDISYIEGLKDYVKIHTVDGTKLVLVNLKNIESKLPGDIFIRAHKSFIVPVDKISSVEGNIIHIGDKEIPIGKEYKETLFEKLINKKLIKR